MYGTLAGHVVWGRALLNLIYDLVALLPRNRTSCENGVLVGKEIFNTDPQGIYVALFTQEVGRDFFVTPGANADGCRRLLVPSQIIAAFLTFHRPSHCPAPENL